MVPLLWRYILRGYFRVFGLSVLAFISVLLVMRFTEIAQFASSGAPQSKVFLFILFQIPFALPFAIPISCLIAALLLFQRLSHTHELTAIRACGLSLKEIATPILFAGGFLALLNFTIASEIGPVCRGLSKKLVYETTAENPLFLLQKDSLVKIKNIYFDMKMNHSKNAEDVVVVLKNNKSGRLSLMTAKELAISGEQLTGKKVCFISNVDSGQEKGFNHLVIENQDEMSTKASNLSHGVQKTDWIINYDYMPIKMLLIRNKVANTPFFYFGSLELEVVRRLSIAIAAFTFTIIGLGFGVQVGRTRSKKGVLFAIALATLYMICYVGAKSARHSYLLPALLYLLPHPIMLFLGARALKKVKEGYGS